MNLAPVDIAFALVLLASIIIGAWRGLLFELISLAGWVGAFVAAQWFAADVGLWLPLEAASPPLRYAAGFACVFVVTAFVVSFLAWVTKKLIEKVGLRPMDRALGAGFGLLRGVLLLLAVALVAGMTPIHQSAAWQASVGAPWLAGGLQALSPLMPEMVIPYLR